MDMRGRSCIQGGGGLDERAEVTNRRFVPGEGRFTATLYLKLNHIH